MGRRSVVDRQVLALDVAGSIPAAPSIPGSSNGRTPDFGSENWGSNPWPGAMLDLQVCQNVREMRRKADQPSKDVLTKMVEAQGYEGTARDFGVTGPTIRRWLAK